MQCDWQRALLYLRCPDDGSRLALNAGSLVCTDCRRRFPILADNVCELLPVQPSPPSLESPRFVEAYLAAFHEPSSRNPREQAWGAPSALSPRDLTRKARHVQTIIRCIRTAAGSDAVLCDMSAGAGHHVIGMAPLFKLVFYCDLSAGAIEYARRLCRDRGLDNVVVVRADYLRPPFRASCDVVVCFDSLMRGPAHERHVLGSLLSAARPGGQIIVDFHNWWHNPVRRMGLMTENLEGCRSYTRSEIARLLAGCGILEPVEGRFVQEVNPETPFGRVMARCIPATRLIYRFPSLPRECDERQA